MKSRPSGEKRRKEMVRQERNREKAEKRKARKTERLEGPVPVEGDPEVVVLPSDGSEAAPTAAVASEAGARPAAAREAVAKDAAARS